MFSKKNNLEKKVDKETIKKASKIGINALQMIVGVSMVLSTTVFADFKPFKYYKPIVDTAGVCLFFYGANERDKKFKYLAKTCKELYEETEKQ